MNYFPHSALPANDRVGDRAALIMGCHPRLQSRYKNDPYASFEVQFVIQDNDGSKRWADWSSNAPKAFLLSNLALRADFAFSPTGKVECFDFRVQFDPVGSIPYHRAWVKDMARTLTRLDGCNETDRGGIIDVVIWIKAAAKLLGVKRYFAYDNDVQRGNLDGHNFHEAMHTRDLMDTLTTIAEHSR